jgi:hypothetical protein
MIWPGVPADRSGCHNSDPARTQAGEHPGATIVEKQLKPSRAHRRGRLRKALVPVFDPILAPALVQAIADNRFPRGIGLTRLADLPSDWSEQFKTLGLQAPGQRRSSE